MSKQDFLLELGTEELPPRALLALANSLKQALCQRISDAGLNFSEDNQVFAAPRRLAVLLRDLEATTPSKDITVWGPPSKIAFDDAGKPTRAAEAFASKNRTTVEALEVDNDGKADKLVYRNTQAGQGVAELLPGFVKEAIAQLPIPKRMRWGSSREEFVRPVHWLVMLYGEQVIEASLLGLDSDRYSLGHRFHHPQRITLASASAYVTELEKAHVLVDFNRRRELIRDQVTVCAGSIDGIAVIDDDLLDEVTALVEWPVALAGRFDEEFLAVPAEALVSSMAEHQKYFHVVDEKGALLPRFITVANIESTDPSQVIAGNERVIRPRLADAAFFFRTDQETTLASRLEKLEKVVFQQQLGTVYDKACRVSELAAYLAPATGASPEDCRRAGLLAKADLVSDMVLEFDKMQGIAGAYYARNDGEPEAVASAIAEHYQPKFAGDTLPESATGIAVALADRLDTLVGIFGIGQAPTGSKDPFALRRASLAVLRIIVEKQLALDLRDVLQQSLLGYGSRISDDNIVATVLSYMLERFRAWYEDAGIPVEVFMSVAEKDLSSPLDIDRRVQAVAAFSKLEPAQALAAANKRVSNILTKQTGVVTANVDRGLLVEDAEQALATSLAACQETLQPLFERNAYTEALTELASLRSVVDAFFDTVMVMAEDEKLRANRLALLGQLRALFLEIADISLLVPGK